MDKQKWLLLGLLGAVVVALYALSVAVGSDDGKADPDRSGGIEAIDGLLGRIPGLGNDLEPSDVDASCFDGERFVLDDTGPPSCSLRVGEDIDRVGLRFVVGDCRIDVSGQDDVIDHDVRRKDADDDGTVRIAITGSGADIDFVLLGGSNRCVLELV